LVAGIITAGFKEVGGDGRELEQQIIQIAGQAGIGVIGPNCLGIIVPPHNVNASSDGTMPAVSTVGYLSQLVTEFPQIQEMDIDISPLMVLLKNQGAYTEWTVRYISKRYCEPDVLCTLFTF
jgi:acyl-CoA synthetase (NDP forming)